MIHLTNRIRHSAQRSAKVPGNYSRARLLKCRIKHLPFFLALIMIILSKSFWSSNVKSVEIITPNTGAFRRPAQFCKIPHNLPDGGDCQALEGLRRPSWACLSDMAAALPFFLEIFRQRPLLNNAGGIRFDHAFALWYTLQQLQPETVIESGVWNGQATWIIRQALPFARIICVDPSDRQKVKHAGVEYMTGINFVDIAKTQWKLKGVNPTRAVIFLDDHQSGYKRVFLQLRHQGFSEFVIDDNFAFGIGDNYSFKWVCEVERPRLWPGSVPDNFNKVKVPTTWEQHLAHSQFLKNDAGLIHYYEFPPVVLSTLLPEAPGYNATYASAPIVSDEAYYNEHLAYLVHENMFHFQAYQHFAYIRVNPNVKRQAPNAGLV